MAIERTPWMIGGGAEHSADVARVLANAATSGATGVTYPSSFKVTAQDVPNGSVRVGTGVGPIASTYPGAAGQTYIVRNLGSTDVTIAPTGSAAGRSDLIIISVTDPQYIGNAPEDPNDFEYTRLEVISGVNSNTRDLSGLNLGRPAIALARIDMPASTGTITQGMIKDLRKIANPKTERRLYSMQPTETKVLGISDAAFSNFPNETFRVDVPEWATHAVIRAEIGSMWLNGSPSKPGLNLGLIRFSLGSTVTQHSWYHHVSISNGSRFGASVADTIAVPLGYRGRDVGSAIQLAANSSSTANWVMDTSSFVSLDVEWQERTS